MRKPSGLIIETNTATGNVREFDTQQCGHCGKHMPMWKHQGGSGYFCSHCSKPICPQCAALGDCDPLPAKLERWAARERLYQNVKEV